MADCQDRCNSSFHPCMHALYNMILWLFHQEMDTISPALECGRPRDWLWRTEYSGSKVLCLSSKASGGFESSLTRPLVFQSIMWRRLSLHSWWWESIWRERPSWPTGQNCKSVYKDILTLQSPATTATWGIPGETSGTTQLIPAQTATRGLWATETVVVLCH